MKEHIIALLTEALPMVNIESDFLFSELDSLGVTTILMLLSEEYGIELDARDATPRNLKTIDAIVEMVKSKLTNQ
ncbi:MAG: acyl carrier protein [Bacteroidaceae bacterium]|nr:acyl carrier protein [Bacteroidaceae bacterium]